MISIHSEIRQYQVSLVLVGIKQYQNTYKGSIDLFIYGVFFEFLLYFSSVSFVEKTLQESTV